jgi:nitroreductase
MQLAAWNHGVASGLFTGIREKELRRHFEIPNNLKPTAVVCFGYPARKIRGLKKRKSVDELVYREKFGG